MKILISVVFLAVGLQAAVNLKDPAPGEIELIIKKFAAKESERGQNPAR